MIRSEANQKTKTVPMRSQASAAAFVALVAGIAMAGCEKTTTTTQTPTGTISSTTIGPTPAASAAIGEAGDAIENSVLTSKVKVALLGDPQVKGMQVEVNSRDGVVTLVGSLDSAADVERAIAVAKGVEGVKAVESRLKAPASSAASTPGTTSVTSPMPMGGQLDGAASAPR